MNSTVKYSWIMNIPEESQRTPNEDTQRTPNEDTQKTPDEDTQRTPRGHLIDEFNKKHEEERDVIYVVTY